MDSIQDMRRYVVKLALDGSEGLGVAVPGHILSCAHFFKTFGVDRWIWLEVAGEIPGEEKATYHVQTLDSLLDFMVIGENPIGQEIDGSCWVVDIEPPIKPVRLVFPDGQIAVKVPVYFFTPDGKTPINAQAIIYRYSPTIYLDQPVLKGCSGGPVFTADHRLIGIIQGGFQFHGAQPDQGHAVRIDHAASGWLCEVIGGLDEWPVQGEFVKVEEID
ncbi:MAG: hypothetical protein WCK89_16045 [bacterium]